eukprot:TRINITY_DN31145_c0_g1_i1.p2 TRINITY_DN31145_c0_g1~~TRINITY_DN31145_c0_g1_i1.p2  ORF type:complete len:116 (+),score=41.05 TRINITY_DN31145_c0_g1_i1:58-405(+)
MERGMERMSDSEGEQMDDAEAPPWTRDNEHELNHLRDRLKTDPLAATEEERGRLAELERRHDLFTEAGLQALRDAEPASLGAYRRNKARRRNVIIIVTIVVVLALVLGIVLASTA